LELKYFFRIFVYTMKDTEKPNANNNSLVDEFDNWYPDWND